MSRNGEESKMLDITFVSTYPPTRCGIATFTHNLRSSLAKVDSSLVVRVVAVDQGYYCNCEPFLSEVSIGITRGERRAYTALAETINKSRTDLVCIQHEFGIFGGMKGSYILDFIERCEKPIVTTLHTLNHNTCSVAHNIIRKIVEKSDALVTLLPIYREYLRDLYGESAEKVEFIPHGVPEVRWSDKDMAKASLGLRNRRVLTSFGLITPNKGLEYVVEALPQIIDRHPNTVYLILGQTHPRILSRCGEAYREDLKRRVRELGLEDYVRFVNDFLSEDSLSPYLAASDIYLAPYLNQNQTSSGCLTYALAHGMAVVSTRYPHSEYELLHSSGVLIPPRDTTAIVKAVNQLLDRPDRLVRLQQTTMEYMEARRWSRVAEQYIDLFKTVLKNEASRESVPCELTNVQTVPRTQQHIFQR